MPASSNCGLQTVDHVSTWLYHIGYRVGENTTLFNIGCGWTHVAVEITTCYNTVGIYGMKAAQNQYTFSWIGKASAFIEFTSERNPGGVTGVPNWTATVADVYDPNNYAGGFIAYALSELTVQYPTISLIMNGGAGLTLMNMVTGEMTIPSAGYLNIGPDLRLKSITGGGKFQARNPGTNTWADVDQWTNP
jgi:hypothetical protein